MSELSNTSVSYMYRDASNYKQAHVAVFAGRLSPTELATVLAAREDHAWFIPSQVGLPDLQERFGSRLYDDDHVWHELDEDGIAPTDAPPDQDEDVHAFAARFTDISWDVEQAMRDVGLPAT